MRTYTRTDIIRNVSDDLDIPEVKTRQILDSILGTMEEMLTEARSRTRIELRNFGVFEVKPAKAVPKARNPRTNEVIFVPSRRKIHFKVGKKIRDVLKREWKS